MSKAPIHPGVLFKETVIDKGTEDSFTIKKPPSFKVKVGRSSYLVEYTVFNGGEINLSIPANLTPDQVVGGIYVSARIQNSDDLIALHMLMDALRREYNTENCNLILGYVPYARQDRVCNKGEALSIKVFSTLINNLNFSRVLVVDPHSEVTTALLDNVKNVVSQEEIIKSHRGTGVSLAGRLNTGKLVLISPDAGATKKTEIVSKAFGGVPVVQGYKKRDLATGELSGFSVYDPDNLLQGATCLIVDDICDGGGTFLGLTKVLKEAGANSIELYVTHGIFSQGVSKLLDNGIDHIYTTDTVLSGEIHERLTYINISGF